MLSRPRPSAFTLVELIASAAVIAILMLMLVQMSRSTGETWKNGMTKAEEFREARRAYEVLTRRLASATLNTYWDYKYKNASGPVIPANAVPIGYLRQSELRFRVLPMDKIAVQTGFHPTHGVFFQSPSGGADLKDPYWATAYTKATDLAPVTRLDGMLATWGYFLEVADANASMPPFLAKGSQPQYSSRLMEFREDAKNLSVYKMGAGPNDQWFSGPISAKDPATPRPVHVVAENVIALVLLPRLSPTDEKTRRDDKNVGAKYQYLSPNFSYDSKQTSNYGASTALPATVYPNQINPMNQLPPVVQVAMVALDQTSAARLAHEAQDARSLDLGTTLLQGLFEKAEDLVAHDENIGDLAELEARLQKRHLKYRLFVSDVSIRGARWSSDQIESTTTTP